MSKSLREELQKIYDAHDQLTGDLVVDEAKDPNHPLHDRFEWDNSVAGHRFRLEQAKRLIRSCKITYRKDTAPQSRIRAFQHIRRTDGTPTYAPSQEVALDPVSREILLRDMKRAWAEMKRRYGNFAEFVDMVKSDPDFIAEILGDVHDAG